MLRPGAKAPAFTLDDLSGAKQRSPEILERGPSARALQNQLPGLPDDPAVSGPHLAKGSLQVIGISQDDERGTARFRKPTA